jgi:putative tricarboxylic transport membrane protein
MRFNEIIFGSVFLLLSVGFFSLTFGFPKQTIALSPTVFPRFVTACLSLLSLLLMAQGIRKPRSSHEEKKELDKTFAVRFLLLAAIGLAYTQAIRLMGYIVATPLFIAGSMLVFGEKKWYRVLLVSIITTAVMYSLFRLLFRVPLPRFELW